MPGVGKIRIVRFRHSPMVQRTCVTHVEPWAERIWSRHCRYVHELQPNTLCVTCDTKPRVWLMLHTRCATCLHIEYPVVTSCVFRVRSSPSRPATALVDEAAVGDAEADSQPHAVAGHVWAAAGLPRQRSSATPRHRQRHQHDQSRRHGLDEFGACVIVTPDDALCLKGQSAVDSHCIKSLLT